MRAIRAVAFVCGSWSAMTCSAEPPSVRELSEPARWEFVGDLSFPVETLRRALACDLDVLAASRSPLPQPLLRALTQALKSGYANEGFPHAEVTASIHAEHRCIVLQVDEGRRYRRGRVEIHGAKTVPLDRLAAAIRNPPPERDDDASQNKNRSKLPEWSKDEPPSFAPLACLGWKAAVLDELQRLGYLDANVRVKVRPEDDGTATFVVELVDEGRRAVLGEVEIAGVTHNSKEELIAFLNLQPGMELNSDSKPVLEAKLRDCGRFAQHEVEIVPPPPFEDGPSRLRFTLHDVPNVPPLSEPLSPLQQTAVDVTHRFRAISEDFEFRIDLPIPPEASETNAWYRHMGSVHLQLASSAAHAGLFVCAEARDREGRPMFQQIVIGEQGHLVWLAPLRRAKLASIRPAGSAQLSATWQTYAPDANGRMSRLMFGMGVSSKRDESTSQRWFRFEITPSALLAEMMRDQSEVELKDGVLSVTRKDTHVEFEIASGRVLKLQMGQVGLLRCGPDLWINAVEPWREAEKQARQQFVPDAPATSLIRFLSDEFLPMFALDPADVATVHRLLDARVLEALDRFLQLTDEPKRAEWFSIPASAPSEGGPLAFLKPWLQMLLPLFEHCFPRETPSWILAREGVFLAVPTKGAPPAAPANLQAQLAQADAGPLVYLLGASLYGKLSPAYRVVLAEAGLEHLTAEDFGRDCRALCRDDAIPGRILRSYTESLREGHEEDLGRLAAFIKDASQRTAIEDALRELARRRDEPVLDVLPDLAERLWAPVFQPHVETALRELALPPEAVRAALQPAVAKEEAPVFKLELEEKAFSAPVKSGKPNPAKPRTTQLRQRSPK